MITRRFKLWTVGVVFVASFAVIGTAQWMTGGNAFGIVAEKPDGATSAEAAAVKMFQAGVTRSADRFTEIRLIGVCDGRIDTLRKYAENLYRTTYRNGDKSFTVYDLPKGIKKDTARVVASRPFDDEDMKSLYGQFVSSYYAPECQCFDLEGESYDGVAYRTRIIVAKSSDKWYAIPRCRSSKLFYEVADGMTVTAADSNDGK